MTAADRGLRLLADDLDGWEEWVRGGIARLEALLASYAEFVRRYGS